MKAMQYRDYSTPDQLQLVDVPKPSPAPTQLLVRVAATSVNPVDWKLHNGQYRRITPVRFPSIPGFDLAGEVTEVGTQGAQPYDLVFDLIARLPLRKLLALLAVNGTYVTSLPSASRIAAAIFLPFGSRRRVRIAGVKSRGADLEALSRLCEAGQLRPVIERVFTLEELAAAHASSQQGRTVGKLVIQIAS